MEKGVQAKSQQNESLKKFRIVTRETILAEAIPRDKLCGIGWAMNDEKAYDQKHWQGSNMLGKILMTRRDSLKKK